MFIKKIFWIIRFFLYSLIYRNISFPGYLGKPIILIGFNKVKFGKKVRVLPHSRFEVYGDNAYIDIQSDVSIGQGFHCTSSGNLTIKSGTAITGNVVVTNIDHDYRDIETAPAKQPFLVKDTIIGENCFIGFGSVIQAGTSLGNHCIVGANSVVRGEFPDYSVIVGSPGKIVKRYNKERCKWESVF
ncbi:acyltransferase [Vibrio sp. F13]|uniref:acyltransferase n=1 Tax=Vibrio sp. F13 TaxID=2070777 RepID=UPI0010BD2B9F|nr:acyltransferase [Vibrio sp. F13]TKF69497.1 acyltransferase [Vibrio sp. F13]